MIITEFLDTILIPFAFLAYNIFLCRENDGEHISTLNNLLYLQNQISGFWSNYIAPASLKYVWLATGSHIDEII